MKSYKVNIINYEFRTKQGKEWSSDDIIAEFMKESSYEKYNAATFINYNDAKAYIEENLRAPYESAVTVGYVITGEIYELEEVGEDGESLMGQLFAKGNKHED